MVDKTPAAVPSKPATQVGESTPDVVYLGAKKVRARYKVRAYGDGPQYTTETVFDYSGVTEEQLYFLANASVVIKAQARLRDQLAANPKFDPTSFKTVDVLKDIVTANATKDPVAAAVLAARKAGADDKTVEALRVALTAANAKK